jgi:tetratricopeptide (TPR) repeat protein
MVWRRVLLLIAWASVASAAPTREEARRRADSGRAHFEAGRYAEAALEFQAAYEAAPEPELLYNLGRCYHAAGLADRAAAEYQRYLNTNPKADDRAEVLQLIEQLKSPAAGPPRASGLKEAIAPARFRFVATTVLLAAGAAVTATSVGLGVSADQTYSSAMAACVDSVCSSQGVDRFGGLRLGSIVTLAVGVAALAAGVVAAILEARRHPRAIAWVAR